MTDANKIRVLVDWVKFQEQSGYPVRLWTEYHSDLCSIADDLEKREAENLKLLEANTIQADRLLAARGKLPHVSVDMNGVRVLGIQGPNQFDPLIMNATLVEHIRELQAKVERLEEALAALGRKETTT